LNWIRAVDFAAKAELLLRSMPAGAGWGTGWYPQGGREEIPDYLFDIAAEEEEIQGVELAKSCCSVPAQQD